MASLGHPGSARPFADDFSQRSRARCARAAAVFLCIRLKVATRGRQRGQRQRRRGSQQGSGAGQAQAGVSQPKEPRHVLRRWRDAAAGGRRRRAGGLAGGSHGLGAGRRRQRCGGSRGASGAAEGLRAVGVHPSIPLVRALKASPRPGMRVFLPSDTKTSSRANNHGAALCSALTSLSLSRPTPPPARLLRRWSAFHAAAVASRLASRLRAISAAELLSADPAQAATPLRLLASLVEGSSPCSRDALLDLTSDLVRSFVSRGGEQNRRLCSLAWGHSVPLGATAPGVWCYVASLVSSHPHAGVRASCTGSGVCS